MIMKAPKHLLNTTEVTTCRNGVKTYHVKMLNALISYSNQNFEQNPLFFIIQDWVSQRNALFYLKVLLGNNFPQFDQCPSKYSSKTCQAETKPLFKLTFFMKILQQLWKLKWLSVKARWNKIWPVKHKHDIVSIRDRQHCLYQRNTILSPS